MHSSTWRVYLWILPVQSRAEQSRARSSKTVVQAVAQPWLKLTICASSIQNKEKDPPAGDKGRTRRPVLSLRLVHPVFRWSYREVMTSKFSTNPSRRAKPCLRMVMGSNGVRQGNKSISEWDATLFTQTNSRKLRISNEYIYTKKELKSP